ncbi:MAG: hypothetical protein L7V85_02215, partial [Bacteroidia bacterium]|nr:hypothetical protein [Bacteroidia bacterium]
NINNIQNLLKTNLKFVNIYTIFMPFCVTGMQITCFFMILCSLISCADWSTENDRVVARVGDVYLYSSDFEEELGDFIDETDSILKTRNYIDSWAKSQLFVQTTKRNLPNSELDDLEELIDQYRVELYTNAYIQSVVNTSLDTIISTVEIDSFLQTNQGVFELNAPLYKARFIHLPPDNVDQNEIQRSFQRFNQEDRYFLDSLSFQYYNYLLADSIWLNKRDLMSEVSFLYRENPDKYLKKSQFFRVEDSLGVYLFYIDELLEKGETAPRVMLESTIKNIIRNQRKLKFTKQFEKDIVQDAIKSKTYETY